MAGSPTYQTNNVTDLVDISGRAGTQLAVSAAAAETTALTGGIYDIWSTVDTWIKISDGTVSNVTVINGYFIKANNPIPFRVRNNEKIGAIAGGAGTLSYHQIGS